MEMRDRIRAIRTHENVNMTQAEFSISLGLAPTSASSWEKKSNPQIPTESMRILICEKFGVNREWLETGEGDMFCESKSDTLDKIAKRYNGSETFRAMLDVYALLTTDQQDAFETYVSMLTQAIASGESPESVQPPETSLSARLGSRSETPEADQDQRRAE